MTHWEAKAENPIARKTRTSETFGGTMVNTTDESDDEPPMSSAAVARAIIDGMREMGEELELTDVPEATFTDPDEAMIKSVDPVLPRSDHNPNQITINDWYNEGLTQDDVESPYSTAKLNDPHNPYQ